MWIAGVLCIIAWARVKGISVCDVWAGVRETTGHWWRTRKKRGTGELVCVHMCQRVCVCGFRFHFWQLSPWQTATLTGQPHLPGD